jgi:UDPglucose 6-dehydrogenase
MAAAPRITIIGFGYVGLTTAVCFASEHLSVSGFDVDADRVAKIKQGTVPFHEPMVAELLRDSLGPGFKISSESLDLGDIIFLTVGTPGNDRDGSIDLSYIKSASGVVGRALSSSDGYRLVVVKSTVVPGTTENIVKPILESSSGKKAGEGFGLAVNPEFLKEGSAVRDMFEPDRLVIGEYDRKSGDVLEELYAAFYRGKMPPLLRTNLVNAELIKYANNAFLATKISFINTIANIAQRVEGADVNVIAKGIGLDNRIGARFLNAGLGFGGSCLPKDVKALAAFSKQMGYDPVLVDTSNEVNAKQPLVALELAKKSLGTLRGKKIAVLGLSFKPNTDDIREAVSLPIIRAALDEGASLSVYDPQAMPNVSKLFGNKIVYAESAAKTLEGADCCIIVTEWDEFRKLGPEDFASRMRNSVVIDGRRVFDPGDFKSRVREFAAVGLG